MQIKVDPGGEKYVSIAKKWLRTLESTRNDLRLPVLQKKYQIDANTQVQLVSSDAGDRIRISAGGDIGFSLYTQLADNVFRELSLSPKGSPHRVAPAAHTCISRATGVGTSTPYFLGQDKDCWAVAGLSYGATAWPDIAVTMHYVRGGTSVYSFDKPDGYSVRIAGVDTEGAFLVYSDVTGADDFRNAVVMGIRIIDGTPNVVTTTVGALLAPYISAIAPGTITAADGASLTVDYAMTANLTVRTLCESLIGFDQSDKIALGLFYMTGSTNTPFTYDTFGDGSDLHPATYYDVDYIYRQVAGRLTSAAAIAVVEDSTLTASASFFAYDADSLPVDPTLTSNDLSQFHITGADSYDGVDRMMTASTDVWDYFTPQVVQPMRTASGEAVARVAMLKSGTSTPVLTYPYDIVPHDGVYSGSVSFRQNGNELFSYSWTDWDPTSSDITVRQHIKTTAGYGTVYSVSNSLAVDGFISQFVVSDRFGARVYAADLSRDSPVPVLLRDGEHWLKPGGGYTLYQQTTLKTTWTYSTSVVAITNDVLGFYALMSTAPADRPELVDKFAKITITVPDGVYTFAPTAQPTPAPTLQLVNGSGTSQEWTKSVAGITFTPYSSLASNINLA